MKYLFWIINFHSILLILTAGCASNQVSTATSTASALDKKLEQQAFGYKRSIQSIQEANFKAPASCENLVAASKRRWDWKEALYTADTCMKARNLSRVEEMGN